jgi:Transposase IS4
VKWGIKIFCVCCSATSYLFNAMFYVGKTQEPDQKQDESVTHQTVKKLLEPLAGKNHRVYMDNYYTGIPLFKDLQNMDIYSTGTIRTNRKGLDQRVTMTKTEETQLKKNPGTTRYSSCGNLVYAAWFDKYLIVKWYRIPQSANGKILKLISICPIVKWYRKWMGAVDRFDQFRA